jgi:GT2 family glycosyltransferase
VTDPSVCILLTTFRRTECAVRTVRALKKHLLWPDLWWMISDDGSEPEHVHAIVKEIGPNQEINMYNSNRAGVGHGMNVSIHGILKISPLVLTMEDDWELMRPLDLRPYVNLLMNDETIGMIRMGYISPGIEAEVVAAEGLLWWKLHQNGYQYVFSGHPNLRHFRYFDRVGYYQEGLPPGQTELDMCAKYNACSNAPSIMWPADYGSMGLFGHIGSDSLAGVQPERTT